MGGGGRGGGKYVISETGEERFEQCWGLNARTDDRSSPGRCRCGSEPASGAGARYTDTGKERGRNRRVTTCEIHNNVHCRVTIPI